MTSDVISVDKTASLHLSKQNINICISIVVVQSRLVMCQQPNFNTNLAVNTSERFLHYTKLWSFKNITVVQKSWQKNNTVTIHLPITNSLQHYVVNKPPAGHFLRRSPCWQQLQPSPHDPVKCKTSVM